MIISTVQVKGGVGKSTIAAHLVGYLHRTGKTVSLLDADPQEAATLWIRKRGLDVEIVQAGDPDSILELLPTMNSTADYVVVDGAAGPGESTRAILLRCDLAIIPVGPSLLDLKAAADTWRLLKQAKSIRNGKPKGIVVLNRMEAHTNLSNEIREAAPLIGRTARAELRKRTAFADSFGQGLFVSEMGYQAKEAAIEIETLFEEVLHNA